jgi:4-amino-4-deoxy-L-arabinose transferase-like glycosyltransferase
LKLQFLKLPVCTSFLLGLFIWVVVLFSLGELLEVFEVSEAREGVVVREIVDHSTWILPLRHGEIVPSKPPLFHVLSASLAKITGEFTEFELRLPSLIAAIFSLIALYIFLHKITNPLVAFVGSGILATSYGFLQLSIDGRVDMVFNFFHTTAYLIFTFNVLKYNGRFISPAASIALSLSVLLSVYTKGPLGLVLFVLYSFPALYMEGSLSLVRKWYFHPAAIITVVGSTLWYVVTILSGQDGIISRHIIFENIQRFLGGSDIPAKPFWYYFLHVWTQTMPWGILLSFALAWIVISKKYRKFTAGIEFKNILKLVLIQSIIILLFLSLASGKRRGYLLMLLPLFSIQLSILFYRAYNLMQLDSNDHSKNVLARMMRRISMLAVLFPFTLTIGSGVCTTLNINKYSAHYSIVTGFLNASFHAFLGISLLSFALCIITGVILSKHFNHKYIYAIFCLVLQIYLAFPANFYLVKGESHSYMEFAEQVQAWRKENNDPEVKFIKSRLDEAFDTFFYYYGQRMRLHQEKVPDQDGYYIARKSWLSEQELLDSSRFTSIMAGGKRKDSTDNYIILFHYTDGD